MGCAKAGGSCACACGSGPCMRLRPMRLRRSARLRRVGLSRCAAQARAGGLSDVASGARLRLLGVVVQSSLD